MRSVELSQIYGNTPVGSAKFDPSPVRSVELAWPPVELDALLEF